MPSPLIQYPALEWAAGQAMAVSLTPIALPAGRTVADFSGFTLTIRADPSWPRSDMAAAQKASADPIAEGWSVAVTSAGAVTNSVPVFRFTSPSGAGTERYALDVFGTLADGSGEVQLYKCRWLSVLARAK